MGKRARRRAKEHEVAVDERRALVDGILERRSRSETVGELRRLADGRRLIDERIDDVAIGWLRRASAGCRSPKRSESRARQLGKAS